MSFILSSLLALTTSVQARIEWRSISGGVEYAAVEITPKPSIGDGILHVVRVDPSTARIRPLAAGDEGDEARTASAWRKKYGLVAVINLGMYDGDFSTHTGFFRSGKYTNCRRWVKGYQSLLLLGPGEDERPGPPLDLRDAAASAGADTFAGWATVVQNLRLIRWPGMNVWKQSDRRWSEAAIAVDRDGKLLLLFVRSPLTMHDFNELILALPLGIVRAMHVEGGPEASLSVHGGGVDLDLSGSYETGFNENDDNRLQWRLPNVLGVGGAALPGPPLIHPSSNR